MVEVLNTIGSEQSGNDLPEREPNSIAYSDGAENSFVVIPEPQSSMFMESSASLNFVEANLETAMQSLNLHSGADHSLTSALNNSARDKSLLVLPGSSSSVLNGLDSLTSSLLTLGQEEKDVALKSLLQENLSLKETVYQNNLRLKQQIQVLSSISKTVQVFQEHKERFKDTRSLVLKAENAKLQQECQSLKEQAKHTESEPSLNLLRAELEESKARYEAEKDDKMQMAEQLKCLRDENKKLLEHVANLKESQSFDSQNTRAHTLQVYELTAKLVEAEQKHQTQCAEIKDAREAMDATTKKLRGRIDEMTAVIVEQQDKISSLGTELQHLEVENSRLSRENEAISILKTQVEIYQSDFLIERGERERLGGEVYQLQSDLRLLHRRNQQLENPSLPTPNADRATENADRATDYDVATLQDPAPPQKRYYCPKCSMAFVKVDPLQLHVELCLQLQW